MKTKQSAGKGDSPRPVNKTVYDSNFSKINWKNSKNNSTNNIINVNLHEQTK